MNAGTRSPTSWLYNTDSYFDVCRIIENQFFFPEKVTLNHQQQQQQQNMNNIAWYWFIDD